MDIGSAITGVRMREVSTKIPSEIFERLLERYPTGKLPTVQVCYYTVIVGLFGAFCIPDFILNVQVPGTWINQAGKEHVEFGRTQARLFTGQNLAPNRGSRIRQWLSNRFLHSVSFNVGYVAWEQHPTLDAPWLVKNEMPDFHYGETPQQALEKFL